MLLNPELENLISLYGEDEATKYLKEKEQVFRKKRFRYTVLMENLGKALERDGLEPLDLPIELAIHYALSDENE